MVTLSLRQSRSSYSPRRAPSIPASVLWPQSLAAAPLSAADRAAARRPGCLPARVRGQPRRRRQRQPAHLGERQGLACWFWVGMGRGLSPRARFWWHSCSKGEQAAEAAGVRQGSGIRNVRSEAACCVEMRALRALTPAFRGRVWRSGWSEASLERRGLRESERTVFELALQHQFKAVLLIHCEVTEWPA